jgi:predicted histidine transporter YuiF (NhaC family)
MGKKALIQRLSWYYPTEGLHAFVTFPILTIWLIVNNPFRDITLLLYGLLVCILILYQGYRYWKAKYFHLKGKNIDQNKTLRFFQRSRIANRGLIALMPVVFIIQLYLSQGFAANSEMILWGILACGFAILEHINYYFRQLMIDNAADLKYIMVNKKLKTSSLAKDLAENKI